MSGGYIDPQPSGGHQVVIFTFAGKLEARNVADWNAAVRSLKERFQQSVTGVTIRGERTPPRMKPRAARARTRRRSRRGGR